MSNTQTPTTRATQQNETLKEGERILAATRRPDGTYRKPIRIRAGYTPQDEVALYQSKGVLLRKGMEGGGADTGVPPGYDPVLDAKPKTKAAKRNDRKKEKKQQTALEKGNDLSSEQTGMSKSIDMLCSDNKIHRFNTVQSVTTRMNNLAVSANPLSNSPTPELTESSNSDVSNADIDKKIRALKKKIRLTEAQQQKADPKDMNPEQLEKVAKLETWRNELKLLEDRRG